jgi:hypothetical protein
VNHYGLRRWSKVAKHLKGRIGKQCRERWNNHVRPDIKVLFDLTFYVLKATRKLKMKIRIF